MENGPRLGFWQRRDSAPGASTVNDKVGRIKTIMNLDNAHFRRRFKRVVLARCPEQKALKYLAATDELPNELRLLYFH